MQPLLLIGTGLIPVGVALGSSLVNEETEAVGLNWLKDTWVRK